MPERQHPLGRLDPRVGRDETHGPWGLERSSSAVRGERFNPLAGWGAIALILMGCGLVGLGMVSGWNGLLLLGVLGVVAGVVLAWAAGIARDTH